MVFSSLTFLCVFLPVILILDRVLPGVRTRNILLLIATAAVFVMLCVIFRRSGMSVAAAIAAPFLLVSLLGILSMALPDGSPLYSRFVLMETFATVERYIRAGEGWVALVTGGAYLLISSVTGIIIFPSSFPIERAE